MASPSEMEDEEAENVASLSIMVQILMLGTTFIIGHVLRRKKILIVHEAGAALLLGVVVGLMVTFIGEEKGFRKWIDFNNRFFFYFLLPPIIFESGWSLKTKPFFDNFGAICVFAFGGTLLSTFAVGMLVWFFGALNLTYQMPFMVCLTFGALISATDPVTVLAIFNELGVNPNLYAYVFGESVLNDAVAIVMYKTVLSFVIHPGSDRGLFGALWFFIVIFIGSFSIGVLVSLLSALLFKYGGFQERELGILESCLVVLFPYLAYMMADAMELSGIVAILFAGITMKYYTAPNLSQQAREITTQFFLMLAKLSETFVFVYMGVAMFLEKQSWENIGFTFFTIISILLARIVNVYPCSYLVNYYREPARHIPKNHQHALWYSGLRGAMAFALSMQSVTDLPNHGRVLLTSTLFTIFFTVLLIGGSTSNMLQKLEIELHGPSGHDEEIEVPESPTTGPEIEATVDENEDLEYEDASGQLQILTAQKKKIQKKLRQLKNDTSFATLDKKYLKPFFAANNQGQPDLESPTSLQQDGMKQMQDAELEDMQPMQKKPPIQNSPQNAQNWADMQRVEGVQSDQYSGPRKYSDPSNRNATRNDQVMQRMPTSTGLRNSDHNSQRPPDRYDSYDPRGADKYNAPSGQNIQKSGDRYNTSSEQNVQRGADRYNAPSGQNLQKGGDRYNTSSEQKIPNRYSNSEQNMQRSGDGSQDQRSSPERSSARDRPPERDSDRLSASKMAPPKEEQEEDDILPPEKMERRSLLLNPGSFPNFPDRPSMLSLPDVANVANRLKQAVNKNWPR